MGEHYVQQKVLSFKPSQGSHNKKFARELTRGRCQIRYFLPAIIANKKHITNSFIKYTISIILWIMNANNRK